MNTILFIISGILLLYIIFQALYSGYYLIKGYQLSADSFPRKAVFGDTKNPPLKLFISGDSVALGLGASTFDTSVAGRIAQHLAKEHYVTFQNESISGKRMGELLRMQAPSEKQDIIVLIVSSNDLFKFTPVEDFRKSTQAVVKKYGALTGKLIIVGPGRVFDGEAVPYFLRVYYKHRSSEYVAVLDAIVKENPKVIHINPTSPEFYKDSYGPTTASDKFHPNDEGHRLWFDLIKPVL